MADSILVKGILINDCRVQISALGLVFSTPVVWFSPEDAAKLRDFLVEHLPGEVSNVTVENEADEEPLVGKPAEFLYKIREEG